MTKRLLADMDDIEVIENIAEGSEPQSTQEADMVAQFHTVNRLWTGLPDDLDLSVGEQVVAYDHDGRECEGVVGELSDCTVGVDLDMRTMLTKDLKESIERGLADSTAGRVMALPRMTETGCPKCGLPDDYCACGLTQAIRTGQVLLDAAAKMREEREALPVAQWLEDCHGTFKDLTGFPAPEHEDAFFCYQVAKTYLARWE